MLATDCFGGALRPRGGFEPVLRFAMPLTSERHVRPIARIGCCVRPHHRFLLASWIIGRRPQSTEPNPSIRCPNGDCSDKTTFLAAAALDPTNRV
jgi:hypothetical protein